MRLAWINDPSPTTVFDANALVFNRATNSFIRGDGSTAGGIPVGGTSSLTWSPPSASATWTIAHNFGFNPNVSCEDSTGRPIRGAVAHPDVNTVVINFSSATGGRAFLS